MQARRARVVLVKPRLCASASTAVPGCRPPWNHVDGCGLPRRHFAGHHEFTGSRRLCSDCTPVKPTTGLILVKVMIVDDNAEMRTLIRSLLSGVAQDIRRVRERRGGGRPIRDRAPGLDGHGRRHARHGWPHRDAPDQGAVPGSPHPGHHAAPQPQAARLGPRGRRHGLSRKGRIDPAGEHPHRERRRTKRRISPPSAKRLSR